MKIKGSYIDFGQTCEGTVDVSPDDLKEQLKPTKEVKASYKVWIEAEVRKTMDFGVWVKISDKQGDCEHFVSTEEIIAAFPAEPEKEKKELPDFVNPCSVNDRLTTLPELVRHIQWLDEEYNKLLQVVKEMREKK